VLTCAFYIVKAEYYLMKHWPSTDIWIRFCQLSLLDVPLNNMGENWLQCKNRVSAVRWDIFKFLDSTHMRFLSEMSGRLQCAALATRGRLSLSTFPNVHPIDWHGGALIALPKSFMSRQMTYKRCFGQCYHAHFIARKRKATSCSTDHQGIAVFVIFHDWTCHWITWGRIYFIAEIV
jgi:hypothetical protein